MGTGSTLTRAGQIVVDLDYDASSGNQAEKGISRIGQTNESMVHVLVCMYVKMVGDRKATRQAPEAAEDDYQERSKFYLGRLVVGGQKLLSCIKRRKMVARNCTCSNAEFIPI